MEVTRQYFNELMQQSRLCQLKRGEGCCSHVPLNTWHHQETRHAVMDFNPEVMLCREITLEFLRISHKKGTDKRVCINVIVHTFTLGIVDLSDSRGFIFPWLSKMTDDSLQLVTKQKKTVDREESRGESLDKDLRFSLLCSCDD